MAGKILAKNLNFNLWELAILRVTEPKSIAFFFRRVTYIIDKFLKYLYEVMPLSKRLYDRINNRGDPNLRLQYTR